MNRSQLEFERAPVGVIKYMYRDAICWMFSLPGRCGWGTKIAPRHWSLALLSVTVIDPLTSRRHRCELTELLLPTPDTSFLGIIPLCRWHYRTPQTVSGHCRLGTELPFDLTSQSASNNYILFFFLQTKRCKQFFTVHVPQSCFHILFWIFQLQINIFDIDSWSLTGNLLCITSHWNCLENAVQQCPSDCLQCGI